MLLKIVGMGFIIGSKAYLKDYWNFMDIIIVLTSWIPVFLGGGGGGGLSAFRTLRILRPLRTIKNIKSLRRILIAII